MQEEIEIISDNKRKRPLNSEVERLYASNKKAKSILQWEPKFSGKEGFKKGLSETIDWFLVEENLANYNSEIYNT